MKCYQRLKNDKSTTNMARMASRRAPAVAAAACGMHRTFSTCSLVVSCAACGICTCLCAGHFGGARDEGERRAKDTIYQMQVSLEDMYNGTTRKLKVNKKILCPKCEGRGGKEGAVKKCDACRGQGVQIRMRQVRAHRRRHTHSVLQLGPGIMTQMQSVCSDCHGEGEIIPVKDRCQKCDAQKVIESSKVIEVHVDRGAKDGQEIKFMGEGNQEPSIPAGNVVIVLDEQAHPVCIMRSAHIHVCCVGVQTQTCSPHLQHAPNTERSSVRHNALH